MDKHSLYDGRTLEIPSSLHVFSDLYHFDPNQILTSFPHVQSNPQTHKCWLLVGFAPGGSPSFVRRRSCRCLTKTWCSGRKQRGAAILMNVDKCFLMLFGWSVPTKCSRDCTSPCLDVDRDASNILCSCPKKHAHAANVAHQSWIYNDSMVWKRSNMICSNHQHFTQWICSNGRTLAHAGLLVRPVVLPAQPGIVPLAPCSSSPFFGCVYFILQYSWMMDV